MQKEQGERFGIKPTNSLALGSTRFSRKWHKILQELEQNSFEKDGCFSVCLMTPHWNYNVNKDLTLKLIDKLIRTFSEVTFYIKPHTRGSGALDDVLNTATLPNFKYITSQTSYELIAKTDVTIAFGTSIIFESILQGKYVINPKFLHTNTTIFDSIDEIYTTENVEETLEVLSFLKETRPDLDEVAYDKIINKYIYNGSIEEPVDRYAAMITQDMA